MYGFRQNPTDTTHLSAHLHFPVCTVMTGKVHPSLKVIGSWLFLSCRTDASKNSHPERSDKPTRILLSAIAKAFSRNSTSKELFY